MHFTNNVVKLCWWSTIALSCCVLVPTNLFCPTKLFGQVQQQGYTEVNQGFSQPPAATMHSSNPGIIRAPVRMAGVQGQANSPVAQATWTTPTAPAESTFDRTSPSIRSTNPTSTSPKSIPFAPPTSEAGKGGVAKPKSSWSSTISMLVSLMLVLTLFMGVAWFFRRVAPQPSRTLSKDVVQVLGRTPLATRHNMILIRFGRKLVLVSQQLGQTQTLSEIDDPQEVDHLLGLCEENNSTSITNSFRDTLYQLASGKSHDRASTSAKRLSIAREG